MSHRLNWNGINHAIAPPHLYCSAKEKRAPRSGTEYRGFISDND
ncbi:hypothetical protein [Oscillatoria sp. FACHB-1406]|nr:hypothetical protein [Oscillatoria sp. FACHB-1406]